MGGASGGLRCLRIPAFLLFYLYSAAAGAPPAAEEAAAPGRLLETKVFPQDYHLYYRGRELPVAGTRGQLQTIHQHRIPAGISRSAPDKGEGVPVLLLEAPGYYPKAFSRIPDSGEILEAKLERRFSRMRQEAVIPTGRQPKSVAFTADGGYLLVPLLAGRGVQVFETEAFRQAVLLTPPEPYSRSSGYVEVLHLPARGEIWFSQMDTASVHIFSDASGGFAYRDTLELTGIWSKVITEAAGRLWVSHWCSRNISEIDPETRKEVQLIPAGGIPRGMAADPGGRKLFTCLFDSGRVLVLDPQTGRRRGEMGGNLPGAARHAVVDRRRNRLYVSDMGRGTVKVFHPVSEDLLDEIKVGPKVNTIGLSRDGRFLFVSVRGTNGNGPLGYLAEGPDRGKVCVVDCRSLKVVDWTWGGNQPTGLDVSPDGRYLVFTNFLDNTLEIYGISRLWEPLPMRNLLK